MVEVKKEEAEKELGGMVDKAKEEQRKQKEAALPAAERQKLEDKRKQDADKQKATDTQAKRDKEILEASEEDLKSDKFTDAERTRKTELLAKKKKADDAKLSPEVLKIKQETQLRIDEINNKLLQLKDTSSKEANELRRQLKVAEDANKSLEEKLTKPKPEDDIEGIVAKGEQERIATYLKEDKDLPREQRREMTKDELDNWLAEDFGAAHEWLSERTARRRDEKRAFRVTKRQEKFAKDLVAKQAESKNRAWAKHPELNISKREEELKAEGKDVKEASKILREENEKHRICGDLMMRNPQKYLYAENGPELLVADMENLLGKPAPTDKKQEQIDELTTKLENLTADFQRLQQDAGITSNLNAEPPEGELTVAEKQYVKTAKELNTPQDVIDKRLKQMRASRKK